MLLLLSLTMIAVALPIMVTKHHLLDWQRPNAMSILFAFHFLVQTLLSVLFLFDPDKPEAIQFFFGCSLACLCIPTGAWVAELFFRRSPSHGSFASGLDESFQTTKLTRQFLLIWLVICASLFVVYVSKQNSYPLRALLSRVDDYAILREMRQDAATGAHGRVFGFAIRFFMPFIFVASLASWRMMKGPWRVIAVTSLVVAFLNNSYATQKDPVAMLFVLGLLLWVLTRKKSGAAKVRTNSRLKRWTTFTLVVVGSLGYPVLIFVLLPQAADWTWSHILFEGVLRRIFGRPAENTYYAFEMIPTFMDYTYFADVKLIAQLSGRRFCDLSQEVAVFKGLPDFVNSPPASVGTFYAQAGWAGLAGSMTAAAATFRAFELILLNQTRKTTIQLAVYCLLLYGAFRFSWASFHTILFSECVFPGMVMLLIWKFVYQPPRPQPINRPLVQRRIRAS